MNRLTDGGAKKCAKRDIELPPERKHTWCKACMNLYRIAREKRRKSMTGVDIDAIHYKLGAVKIKDAA